MQLLSIHTIPLRYEIHCEPARLEMKDASAQPVASAKTQSPKLTQHLAQSQIQMDGSEMRKAFGLLNNTDFAKSRADDGVQNIQDVTQNNVDVGKQLSHIEKGVTISDIVKQKALQQPTYVTVFLPNGGTKISWTPAQAENQYDAGSTSYDWETNRPEYTYIPGSFSMKITQWPRVEIEYLGGFSYVPPSANPDYEEEITAE